METKLKTVYKIKWNNLIKIIFTVILVIMGILLLFNVYIYLRDNSRTNKVTSNIYDKASISSIVDDEYTKTIAPDSKLSKFDSYWDYIKLGLIDVDMASLKRINSSCVGYIEVKSTEFSYPVLDYSDGFYKNHSFDKKDNSLGWIYLSSDSTTESLSQNTVIYGNKTFTNNLMSKLDILYKDSWKSDDDNYIIRYYTNYYSSLWQIISVYKTTDKDYTKSVFTDDELEKFINTSLDRSEIKLKADAKVTDKFLTLTTNSNGKNIVVLAKLIKIREQN